MNWIEAAVAAVDGEVLDKRLDKNVSQVDILRSRAFVIGMSGVRHPGLEKLKVKCPGRPSSVTANFPFSPVTELFPAMSTRTPGTGAPLTSTVRPDTRICRGCACPNKFVDEYTSSSITRR